MTVDAEHCLPTFCDCLQSSMRKTWPQSATLVLDKNTLRYDKPTSQSSELVNKSRTVSWAAFESI